MYVILLLSGAPRGEAEEEIPSCGLDRQWCCGLGEGGECVTAYECLGISWGGCDCCAPGAYGYDLTGVLLCYDCIGPQYVFDVYCPESFQVCALCTDNYECANDDDCPGDQICQDRMCRDRCGMASPCGADEACSAQFLEETDDHEVIEEIALCAAPLVDECEDDWWCETAQEACELVEDVLRCVPRCAPGEWYDWPLEAVSGTCCPEDRIAQFDDGATRCCPEDAVFDGTSCCPLARWSEGYCCPEGTTVDRLGTCCTDPQRDAAGDCLL